jgi:hypothetical protein
MSTPHQDGLPALPEPDVSWVDGKDQYGYDTYDHAFSASLMRDYALLALRSAAPSAQPVQAPEQLKGTPRREDYVRMARIFALAYGLHDDAPAYLPRTKEDADSFIPHGWVIAAMMQAFGEGWADGHAGGIEFMKLAAPPPVQQAGELTATDAMALAFHRALTDGALDSEGLADIKTGLNAVFSGLGLAAALADAQPAFTPGFADGILKSQELHTLWETSKPTPTSYHTAAQDLAWQLGAFASKVMARVADAQPVVPALTVWFGSMPESNGRENWTVMLRRNLDSVTTDNMHDRHRLLGGMTLFRSEYKDRMRYHADELRFLLGEIDERPDILAYDADLRSAYVEPTPQPVEKQAVPLTDEQIEKRNPYQHSANHRSVWAAGFRDAERAHGITPPADEGEKL